MFRTFVSFRVIWREQRPFAASLLQNLMGDIDGAVSSEEEPGASQDLQQLLSLLNCVTAIMEAAFTGAPPPPSFDAHGDDAFMAFPS
jgi:hypothetical protein